MDRPTKERVNEILRSHNADCSPDSLTCILAAEVNALRGELADARTFNERAFVAEVKALREDNEWRMRELREARAELDKLRALRMLALAYKRDFEENHTDAIASRYELFEALDD